VDSFSPARACAFPSRGLAGTVTAPGDKSVSHRALILAALAEGESRIAGLLESADVLATARALRAFGVAAERDAPGCWRVQGGAWRSPAGPIDCGNSGTAARLLMGAAAGFPIEAVFDGDASLRHRPMRRAFAPLAAMGARFEGGDCLPLRLRGRSLRGISYQSPVASAQVKSAILLAGLRAEGPVEVTEPTPSRDHTEIMLRAMGAEVTTEGTIVRLGARRSLRAADLLVPGDPSSAAFPIVAALIVPGSDITITGVMVNTTRIGLFDTLREMGADLQLIDERMMGGERVADVRARFSQLQGVEVPGGRVAAMIDEYPILAVAAAFAQGTTRMSGLAELRHKESDRLAAILCGLQACGVPAEAGDDSLTVTGGMPEGGAVVATEGDHRIAMAFLVLGLAARKPVRVDRPEMIATSFPDFFPLMQHIGARLELTP
jgi:3-phosphoshikimate 1-carboxyvinyltransferase